LNDPVFFAPFIPFFDPRPGRPSTPMEVYLRKLTTRCGSAAVDGCKEALLAKAAEAKLLRTPRLSRRHHCCPLLSLYGAHGQPLEDKSGE
jgi:IS5 family transposase